MPFCVCVCVCIVLCNVYWCELMLDSKRYWMWKFLGRNPNNKVKLNLIEYKKKKKNSSSLKINNQWWNKDKKLIASNRTKTYINKKRYTLCKLISLHCVN